MDQGIQPPSSAVQPGPQPLEPDLTGQVLGDFRVLRRLGQGGMGQVYLAEQISLRRKVALKILRAELAADTASLQRFKAEAANVARATHANIVQVYAIGEDKDRGLHYMALEYVEGRNLREYLEKKGPPEVLAALSIMRQVASALQRASELGIIHRDIKPENILLTRKGEAKVADFGLSRCFAESGQALHLTQSGVSMGTPLYMSPEQVECKPVDHRTDIYSFGVTCYHMLAGTPPFKGQSPFEVAFQHVQKEPVPLSEIRPDLPPDLCALVHKMMAKKPEERFQTGREVVKELVRLRDALVGVSGIMPAITLGPVPAQKGDAVATQIIPPRPARHRWRWLVPASILLALGGGLLAGWYWQRASVPSSLPANEPSRAQAVKDREKELRKLVREHLKPVGPLDLKAMTGLQHSIELGLLYLQERQLDAANQFFQELANLKVPLYRGWGKLGQAMVLAFKDQPAASNKIFLAITRFDKTEKGPFHRMVINAFSVREMIAEALDHNFANAPGKFPKDLERYRHPPAAVVKPPL